MGKTESEHLNRILTEHLNTVHETRQALDQAADSSLDKVSWDEVIKMGEQVYKQATLVGMLWTGVTPEVKALEENMATYFNILQGFVLLSHGSTVGAGPTLSSYVHTSVKQVVDCSFMLWKESVSSYGSQSKEQKLSVPQLVGAVWDACSALKKTPATDITAIGRAIAQVAVPMKDVLREMKELKQASPDLAEEATEEVSAKDDSEPHDSDNSSEGDMGNDLSHKEMKVAQFATTVVSDMLMVLKELIRSVTLLKKDDPDGSSNFVNSLEKLLKLCQGIALQIDRVGACIYPPQEYHGIKDALKKISGMVDDMQVELNKLNSSSETFLQACNGLRRSLEQLASEIGYHIAADLIAKIEDLCLTG